jgi:hypothetical protein
MKLYPRCLREEKPVAFSATGYFVPCCWCDNANLFRDFKEITQEKFHISNIDSPDDVFESDEWKQLIDTIKNDGSNAPKVCRKKCSSRWSSKEVIVKC